MRLKRCETLTTILSRRNVLDVDANAVPALPLVKRTDQAESLSAPRKIGYLHPFSVERTFIINVLRPRWRELGYVAGETVLLRSAQGDIARMPTLIAELVSLGVGARGEIGLKAKKG